jgi:hypothetical protein
MITASFANSNTSLQLKDLKDNSMNIVRKNHYFIEPNKRGSAIEQRKDEEFLARFVKKRTEHDSEAGNGLTWVGIVMMLLILTAASFNARAQLPDPGMQIDPLRIITIRPTMAGSLRVRWRH